METMATGLGRHAGKHRRWVWFGILRSFYDVAIVFSLSVTLAWYWTQSLFILMKPAVRGGAL